MKSIRIVWNNILQTFVLLSQLALDATQGLITELRPDDESTPKTGK